MNKRMTARDAVAELRDGMTLGVGGWGARRKPMALVREIARSSLTDLTLVTYGGPEVGILCALGKVKKLVFGFVSLDLIPLDAHFRAARQAGKLPDVMEIDEGMLQWGLKAAMIRVPFLPCRAGLATDVETLNPELRTVESPYDDKEVLLAMPALELDAAIVHVDHCDERGNGQILGPDPYFDDLFCGAAKKRFVSCESILSTQEMTSPGLHPFDGAQPDAYRRSDRSSARSTSYRVCARSTESMSTTSRSIRLAAKDAEVWHVIQGEVHRCRKRCNTSRRGGRRRAGRQDPGAHFLKGVANERSRLLNSPNFA